MDILLMIFVLIVVISVVGVDACCQLRKIAEAIHGRKAGRDDGRV